VNVAVVLPTYNEAENVSSLIPEVVAVLPHARIVVVDDNSPDGTADGVRRIQASYPQVELRTRPLKLGLGSAYVETFLELRRCTDVDVVCTMDSDFSHDPRALLAMLDEIVESDVVIGSRYVPEGSIHGWHAGRRLLSKLGNAYARIVAGAGVRDLTSGLVCFRREILSRMPLEKIHSSGYAYTIESKCLALRAGARLKEVPIRFVERRGGRSKLTPSIVTEGVLAPWRVRLDRISR
jgi:dolichol-phosphate mannosyltransferase